jgi:hypothetical protein
MWPTFDAPLLKRLAEALRRRSRAIRYKAMTLTCGRDWSETPEGVFERLNVEVHWPAHILLSVWSDGEMWLRACRAAPGTNAGWEFQVQFYSDLREIEPALVVEKFEASMDLCYGPQSPERVGQLLELWNEGRI